MLVKNDRRRHELRVMPKIVEKLLKYLEGVIETRKNGYTNNYREMLMKEAHLEAFENVRGWLINELH
jgi:SUMO ligase MMS21 Smc5/6 complex component